MNYVRYHLVRPDLPKGNTSRAIEQEIIDGNTCTAANGAEPIQLVFDCPINVTGNCVEAPATSQVRPRRVGFEPEYE
jgi:hypothetical protein